MLNGGSYGQSILRDILSRMIIGDFEENFRPDWLFGMELDFWFERHNLAFEFQGDQHYIPVFGVEAFEAQKCRDRLKRNICRDRGITLIAIDACDLKMRAIRNKLDESLASRFPLAHWRQRKKMLRALIRRHYTADGARTKSLVKQREYIGRLRSRFGNRPTTYRPQSKRRTKSLKAFWSAHSASASFGHVSEPQITESPLRA